MVGNGTDLGFFVHPTIVVNPHDKSFMGAIDLHFWNRPETENQEKSKKNQDRFFEEKESYRWAERAITAREQLSTVEKVIVVQDREGDIYESFYALQEQNVDFVIRLHHDRKIIGADGEKDKLKSYIEKLSSIHEYELEIKESKKRKTRKALMEIRFGIVELCRPEQLDSFERYQIPP